MPDWSWLLLAALLGALAALVVPLALLAHYLHPYEKKKREEYPAVPVTLPADILNELTKGAGCTPEGALNAMLQFIFQQSTADTRWLRRRMATELAELLAKTSSGKIFESLTLRSLEVGSEFPSITNLRVVTGELEEDNARLRSLDLKFDLAYDGNFRIDVDAVMLLGKIANISITVESLSGNVRVMFRRLPYTHWALAFETPPRLQLLVRPNFFRNICIFLSSLQLWNLLSNVCVIFHRLLYTHWALTFQNNFLLYFFTNKPTHLSSSPVESLSGNVRVMFRRLPYTHWALAFETPPRLQLQVRGRFQGRQLKPRLAALVAAHIRRAVAQRHTLPHYKIRYD
ncbi:unnamed protein product [Plutella xylostella]|uniref:(diamondback moth) hypothetical protein n=1 Tax=Plutella xylostella TaxID=51655 RepID=A0A8S4E4S2_PLUXY|nr:unnamed protein product [Plutella xylostella]